MYGRTPYNIDPLRVAETPHSATRKGSRDFYHPFYIGRRHFVPRPMPMERASLRMRPYPHLSHPGRGARSLGILRMRQCPHNGVPANIVSYL